MEVVITEDDWFYDSIPMSEDPPHSDNFKSGLPDGGPNFSWEDTAPSEYEPPYENPLDSMPIAKNTEDDWFTDKPKKKEETMHEKMYRIATDRYNPFSVGGSENCDSDISCNNLGGGSEQHG